MNYRQIMLTPEIAEEWLGTMPGYQRKASAVVVAEYAKDMADGRWVANTGDAIRFNRQGQMIDGQHRCMAVVESGVPIPVILIEGLDDEVFMVLDKGRKRTAADSIGGKNANVRAAIAKAIIALDNGVPAASIVGGNQSSRKNPISATEAAEVAMLHDKSVSRILKCFMLFKSANRGRFSSAVATCLAAYVEERFGDMDTLYEFCVDLNKPTQDRPVICTMAREKAENFMLAKGAGKNTRVFAIYLIAYRHWLDGTVPKIIQPSGVAKRINSIPLKRNWLEPAQE